MLITFLNFVENLLITLLTNRIDDVIIGLQGKERTTARLKGKRLCISTHLKETSFGQTENLMELRLSIFRKDTET